MLKELANDKITLVKSDGQIAKDGIPALVTSNKVLTSDQTLPLEVGDHILRKLPSGLVEDYEIIDPKFLNVGPDSHFQIEVRKVGAPRQQATVIQGITNNISGANARVNINSTDNSTNVSADISPEALRKFVEQARAVVSHLPISDQEKVEEKLRIIETETKKSPPSKLLILEALQSLKSIAEGASGNLVAGGIISLIKTFT